MPRVLAVQTCQAAQTLIRQRALPQIPMQHLMQRSRVASWINLQGLKQSCHSGRPSSHGTCSDWRSISPSVPTEASPRSCEVLSLVLVSCAAASGGHKGAAPLVLHHLPQQWLNTPLQGLDRARVRLGESTPGSDSARLSYPMHASTLTRVAPCSAGANQGSRAWQIAQVALHA